MNNRFENFTQREIEILLLALDQLDSDKDFLPQHKAPMDHVRWTMRDELDKMARATNNSRDGSHFGETY